jgi:16S rRNA (cytosine967-C5)-methyltransferase
MFARSYINTATDLLNNYNGTEPFHLVLKKHFSANKKYGSRDRKAISQLCYCYFRLGHSFKEVSDAERILIGLFLCSASSNEILAELRPDWNENTGKSLQQKLSLIYAFLSKDVIGINNIFPWKKEISDQIDEEMFNQSFLIQPDLFLRIRPGYKEIILSKLSAAGIEFEFINNSCIAMANATKVEVILNLDREAVVQDYNSQQTLTVLQSEILNLPAGRHGLQSKIITWDCCAGSGGKSILLYDLFPNIELTVSDVRQRIIQNLHSRFKKAGIKNYQSFIADITNSDYRPSTSNFDLIICDAPCTGSGTWGRTPEQLYFFEEKKVDHYAALQKNIALNASRSLKKNGLFLYITCSVFRRENEDVVNFIQDNTQLKLNKMEYLKGYNRKADTLFSALFTKS